jgi:hypothetical protein
MSKAEDLAEKTYPKGDIYIFGDGSIACQVAYVKGYRQAEKDLELTWEDIKTIDKLLNQCVDCSNPYQEVLKRFKEMKK